MVISAKLEAAPTGVAKPHDQIFSSNVSKTDEEIVDISRSILQVFFDYALNKIDHSESGFERGCQNFVPVVSRFVAEGKRVEACLPAFPFKSANKVYKVLGRLPDKAEELALDRLNTMCKRIEKIYPPGAQITIVSDGIVYSDLLSISDQDTWLYGEALRVMAAEKNFDCIGFSSEKDLLNFNLREEMREIIYVANCANFRRVLLNKYDNDDIDIDHEIATNEDTKLTYLGYKRFLESDLKHIFPRGANRSGHAYTKDCKYIAKQMLIRGYAFAGAVRDTYPNHLRLSIHESIGAVAKISVSLLNTRTGFTTPWHCSVAQLADGEWISAPMGEFLKNSRLELVQVDGVPSHFVEKPDQGNRSETLELLTTAKTITSSEYLSKALATTDALSGTGLQSNDSASSSAGTDEASTSDAQSSPSTASSVNESVLQRKISHVSLSGEAANAPSIPYGRRLLPHIMDSLALEEPSRIVFSLPTYDGDSFSLRDISAHVFAQAVNKLCWWLRRKAGKSNSVLPIGYIGPSDLRYVLLVYACVKVGYAALFLSPESSTEDTIAVVEQANMNILVTAGEVAAIPIASEVLQKRPMKVLQLPLLDHLLDSTSAKPFPYTKTFDEAINDPFCYVTISSPTRTLQPTSWSHGLIGAMDSIQSSPRVDKDDLLAWISDCKVGDKIYSTFPISHGAGVIMNIIMPALHSLNCILAPANDMSATDLIEKLAETAKVDKWDLVPSFVNELGEAHIGTERMQSLFSKSFLLPTRGNRSGVGFTIDEETTEHILSQPKDHNSQSRIIAVLPIGKDGSLELGVHNEIEDVKEDIPDSELTIQSERDVSSDLTPIIKQDEGVDPTIPLRWPNSLTDVRIL
ncbi:Pyoverdine/dityrosine biosynthesis protein-domain-containing protein [Xylaria arbuscula]|nr:Pyoverdine/dityrosine biosynthesis protein-domain-containing protein [Xylaria arbuscula]